ncbi:ATP-binding cassette domain-containing protein [Propionibacterium australiense]|uniref:UvrABC system protein A n=1 Tax=Propionibacterium australiense TaxID=119981 RepID=A0A8B3FMK4_9ACTN|nr:excinuclease ABC subunit UvrA [Propionibacterium australiense]RLP10716.1 excinuclease ABC subunit UvrA [Propionibacterium australiense]
MTHDPAANDIEIIGAAENNLKHVDVIIPKGRLVVFAGVSGSGKSSLAFDTIAVESSRQWQASYPLYLRNKMPHYERPRADELRNLTPAIVVDQRPLGTSARSTVGTAVDVAPLMRLLFSRVGEPSAGGSMAYSFNHPLGMCPECTGLGEKLVLDEDTLFDPDKTLAEGAILFSQFSSGWQTYLYQANPLLDADKPLRDFTDEEWDVLRNGSPRPVTVEIRSNNTGRVDAVDYEGVIPRFNRLYLNRDISKLRKTLQEEIRTHVHQVPCAVCDGSGLNPKALASRINGHNIVDLMDMSVRELSPVLERIDDPRGSSLAAQITAYLERMIDVGLGYLSLSRRSDTLSGGEAQRIKMVRNLGSSLADITYIFDEPTAGLHPADAERIGRLLVNLRERHNNVLVVEHSRQMFELADHIIELGPAAGEHGGRVVYQGDLPGLRRTDTPTARAMARAVTVNPAPLTWSEGFEITDAHRHNLRHVDVTIPKGVLTAITGVAGSGKSTLATYEFAARHREAIVIDQKPIGTSIRSTPATYTGAMDEIRKLFARANGVAASWFSFNSKGACPVCKGKGKVSYDMAFAEPVEVPCEECEGHRYNPTALGYTYKQMNIEEVMALTIEQALEFFEDERVCRPLRTMIEVGLEYLRLGQPTSTLSGGEVQRVKLSSELYKRGNVYILDEPSTGLHNQDLDKLLQLLRRLVSNGNTVVIVEHRLELIAQADWVIDMGPGGGSEGGEVLFCGTPEGLVECPDSRTGRYLSRLMHPTE